MEIFQKQNQRTFTDYLYVLVKWKNLIIINLVLITVVGTVFSFLVNETFKADAIVMVTNTANQGSSGLSSLLSGDLSSLGSQLLSGANTSNEIIFGILSSRTLLTKVVNQYDLMNYYGVKDQNIDITLKNFLEDLDFEQTENGLLQISVINKDPKLAAKIANYFVQQADSTYIALNIEQARNNRAFIEKRYLKNLADLKSAEDSFYIFQKKYGVAAIPEQMLANIQVASEVEAKLISTEITASTLKEQFGVSSPQYLQVAQELKSLREKVQELKNSNSLYENSNILFPFKDIPDISIQYYRYFREIEVQSEILKYILPMYEQALVEEQKSYPNLIVIDHAVPPQLKYAPKKALIILMFFSIGLFIHIIFIFWLDRMKNQSDHSNPIETKGRDLAVKIKQLYRLNI